jgi:O-antigen/teichoic acid export membrane protein
LSALNTMGQRIGSHAGKYSMGSAIGVVLGLVSLAVLTRFLPPSEYGLYALYVALANTLGMVYGLIAFKGSIRAVFGGDDDDDDEDEDEDGDGRNVEEGQARRALGTALTLIALLGLVGTGIVALVPQAAQALLGQSQSVELFVIYAAAAGGLGAVWRLASNVPRRERRSQLYVVLQTARPLFVLAATVPLVIESGLAGAVLGLLIGNAVSLAVSLFAIRHSWVPAFEPQFLSLIVRRGTPYMPLVLSFWAIQEGNVFLLAQFAGPAEVGVFRVASQVAAFGGFVVVAFLRASGPLTREPIYKAVRRERGPDMVGTLMTTYFAYGSVFVLLAFALAADVLVQIAPPAYAAAAPLVPLLVLAGVANGWYRVVYRYSRFPSKKRAKISFAVVAGIVFFASGLLLVPDLGAYGIGWAATLAFTVATLGLFVMSLRSENPIRLARRRIVAGVVLGALCYGTARALEDLVGVPSPLTATLAIVAYPSLLVVSGVIPRRHVGPLRDISIAALPLPRRSGSIRLKKLSSRQFRVLRMIARDDLTTAQVATKLRTTEEDVDTTFVAGLRKAGGLGKPASTDPDVVPYLLHGGAIADKDLGWKRLAAEGVDPLETDAMLTTLRRLKRAPRSAWKKSD